jgi:PAS domain S-box-containing protein
VIVGGVLLYSYTYQWFQPEGPVERRWRATLSGVAFGGLAVVLMIARIQIRDGVFIDLRSVPIALVALFEGWPAALISSLIVAVYRWAQGGAGAPVGVLAALATGAAGALVHAWARRGGGITARHVGVLAAAAFAIQIAALGALPRGVELLPWVWLPYLVGYAIGIGLVARLLRDVVERSRLATELSRFRAVVDDASDAIRIVDADSRVVLDANRMDCTLSGYTREELIGRVVPEPPREAHRTEDFIQTFAVPFQTRSGAVLRVDVTRRTVEHDRRRYEVIIYRDAAGREAAEAAQREASSLRAVAEVAAAAAHEINNPLAVVVGSLGLLGKRLTQGDEARWVDQALAGSERIRDIVLRMGRITRLERGEAYGTLPAIIDIQKSSDVNTTT